MDYHRHVGGAELRAKLHLPDNQHRYSHDAPCVFRIPADCPPVIRQPPATMLIVQVVLCIR